MVPERFVIFIVLILATSPLLLGLDVSKLVVLIAVSDPFLELIGQNLGAEL